MNVELIACSRPLPRSVRHGHESDRRNAQPHARY